MMPPPDTGEIEAEADQPHDTRLILCQISLVTQWTGTTGSDSALKVLEQTLLLGHDRLVRAVGG